MTLVETAGLFYMLQVCMQGVFQKNLEKKVRLPWKILYIDTAFSTTAIKLEKKTSLFTDTITFY